MSYREKLDIGMTAEEVVEVLGEPLHKEESGISAEWKWERIIEEGKEYEAVVDFTGGKVSAIIFSSPDSPPVDIAEVLFSALGRSVK